MLISIKFYKNFLLSKYSEDEYAKDKLRELFKYFVASQPLSSEEKDAVELETLGAILPPDHRRVNDSILESHDIIQSFLNDDYVSMAGRHEQNKIELNSDLNSLERSVEKIRQDIMKGMTPEGIEKAKAMGLL